MFQQFIFIAQVVHALLGSSLVEPKRGFLGYARGMWSSSQPGLRIVLNRRRKVQDETPRVQIYDVACPCLLKFVQPLLSSSLCSDEPRFEAEGE